MIKLTLCFALILVGCGVKRLPTPAPKGGFSEVGNGGDLCELEYRGLIPGVRDWYSFNIEAGHPEISHDFFLSKLLETTVQCVDEDLSVDGVPKTAVTYPDLRLTKVNNARWNKANRLAKEALVAHEGLVLVGLEKTNDYHLSETLWHASERPFTRFVCTQHVDGGASTGDIFFQIVPSLLERVGEETHFSWAMYKATLSLQQRRNKEFPDLKLNGPEKQSILVADHLRCATSELDPRVLECDDFDGPFAVDEFPIIQTSAVLSPDIGLQLRLYIRSLSLAKLENLSNWGFSISRSPLPSTTATIEFPFSGQDIGWIHKGCEIE